MVDISAPGAGNYGLKTVGGSSYGTLDGTYDLNIRTETESGEQFLHAVCDRLGLAATPARRNVTMLVVRDA